MKTTTIALRRLGAAASTLAVVAVFAGAQSASGAAGRDRDHDGIPNRWEAAHGLDPDKAEIGRAHV